SNEIVYRRHRRRQRMIGIVDVSGSMARFALWSILSLAVLFPSVSYIVLFSERSNVYRSPVKKTARMLAGFLEKLYTEGFKGYTNISDALRRAGELALRSNSRTMVLFSDLKQTIPDVDPWIVAGELVKKGLKVIIVVPRSIEEETIEKYRKEGCDVVVVENPENIANILKRRINLKNRV
ncbi:MAG: VWA domain-containing protein, partial [Desulfurococcus sp.]